MVHCIKLLNVELLRLVNTVLGIQNPTNDGRADNEAKVTRGFNDAIGRTEVLLLYKIVYLGVKCKLYHGISHAQYY